MPTNILPKDTPRGRGPEPSRSPNDSLQEQPEGEEEKSKECDLAAQEIQELWESQEIGLNVPWSGEAGHRFSDPD